MPLVRPQCARRHVRPAAHVREGSEEPGPERGAQ